MPDESYLDLKYFIDSSVYNCPFCNRRNVAYKLVHTEIFDWTDKKKCYVYFIRCESCANISMHLSYKGITDDVKISAISVRRSFKSGIDIDSEIFYSVPTSFFVLDDRIPSTIRELIAEAEGCIKMNFLTGASACTRKAIYELIISEKAEGEDYESRIKFLKKKYPDSDPSLFDILSHIKDMTSDKIHEQSWDRWNAGHLKLFIETLKTVLHDIYVAPKVKSERSSFIQQLLEKVTSEKRGKEKGA
jgi:hypothetical protein